MTSPATPNPAGPFRQRWRRIRPRLTVGAAATVLGWLSIAVTVGAGLVRALNLAWQPAIVAAAFAPYLMAMGITGSAALILPRSRRGGALALLVLSWAVLVQLPLFTGQSHRLRGPILTVLQANLRVGRADPASLVALVRAHSVGVLTVEELTAAAITGLTAAGLDRELPYRVAVAFPGGGGTGIWSRYPLHNTTRYDQFSFEWLAATVTVPQAPPARIFAVHLLPPWPYPAHAWLSEMSALREMTQASQGGVIVSGDFNATLDNAQYRGLLKHGLRDGAESAGSGFTPTYPTDRHFPPLLTLDHVLVRGAEAETVRTVTLPGSDHRGLLAQLRLARAGSRAVPAWIAVMTGLDCEVFNVAEQCVGHDRQGTDRLAGGF